MKNSFDEKCKRAGLNPEKVKAELTKPFQWPEPFEGEWRLSRRYSGLVLEWYGGKWRPVALSTPEWASMIVGAKHREFCPPRDVDDTAAG